MEITHKNRGSKLYNDIPTLPYYISAHKSAAISDKTEWFIREKKFALVRVFSAYQSPRWFVFRAVFTMSGDVAFWQEIGTWLYKKAALRNFNKWIAA